MADRVSGKSGYDIVINNGRVIDPLTGFDGVVNVGIRNGIIADIVSISRKLKGKKEIDASGLVVAPGFINVHSHATDIGKGGVELYIRDGITTEISGNCGIFDFVDFSEFEKDAAKNGLISNIATYVGHNSLRQAVGVPDNRTPAGEAQLADMINHVRQSMKDGALGVSFGPFYGPGATYDEMLALAKVAAEYGGCSASHVREGYTVADAVNSVNEGVRTAREAGVPFIISHTGGGPTVMPKSSGPILEAVFEGLQEGLKLAVDFYGYDAFLTLMAAPVFDLPMETLNQLMESQISDLEIPSTVLIDGQVYMEAGQRFSSVEQFQHIRQKVKNNEIPDPGLVGHLYKPSKLNFWMSCPLVMVENDCTMSIDKITGKYAGHPKDSGAFAHFLGYWVREKGVCDLRTALARTSSMAATFLGLDKKGRVQVGCDADITIFDANAITDKSTYIAPGLPSEGIPYVIVNGVVAVDAGRFTGVRAGRPIKRNWAIPGEYPNLGKAPSLDMKDLVR
jgi:N-acyl-D-amino-acid deacylase